MLTKYFKKLKCIMSMVKFIYSLRVSGANIKLKKKKMSS